MLLVLLVLLCQRGLTAEGSEGAEIRGRVGFFEYCQLIETMRRYSHVAPLKISSVSPVRQDKPVFSRGLKGTHPAISHSAGSEACICWSNPFG